MFIKQKEAGNAIPGLPCKHLHSVLHYLYVFGSVKLHIQIILCLLKSLFYIHAVLEHFVQSGGAHVIVKSRRSVNSVNGSDRVRVVQLLQNFVRFYTEEGVVRIVLVKCKCIIIPQSGVADVKSKVVPDVLLTCL